MGLGAWIWETDSGRPLGMSTVRDWRLREDRLEDDLESLSLEEEEERDELLLLDLDEDDDLEDLEEDFDEEWCGTSRMFNSRPVVGSTVESTLGLWATWYPSMM
jgi:hypothetical protein